MSKKDKKETFEKRLKVYSAAAAGVLAIAPAAEAAIVYSGPQHLYVSSSNFQAIDLNNDGHTDFFFGYSTKEGSHVGMIQTSSGLNFIDGGYSFHNDPARLPSNYLIQNTLQVFNWDAEIPGFLDTLNGSHGSNTNTSGNFNNATGYIGVRFNSSCGTTYGWIQYHGSTSIENSATGTIIDWAYEDNCQPILTGQTESAGIPTMNQWGIITLVLLLAGLSAKMLMKEEKGES